MKLTEAHRQYQDALEHYRRTKTEYENVMTADDLRDDALEAVEDARKAVFAAWAMKMVVSWR